MHGGNEIRNEAPIPGSLLEEKELGDGQGHDAPKACSQKGPSSQREPGLGPDDPGMSQTLPSLLVISLNVILHSLSPILFLDRNISGFCSCLFIFHPV